MGRTNDTVKILAAIQKNMDKKSWPCIYGGCDQHAINSHLLQRHGVLDRVVENGHLYEVKRCDYYKWNRNPPIEFKMVGLNRAISLPLFCHEHDSRLFRSIEQDEIDCSDYRMQLLLCYRTVCAEIRKKEMNIEFLGRMKKSSTLQFLEDVIDMSITGNELGIRDLDGYKSLLEQELEKISHNFFFVCYRYPLVKVYASSVFSYHPNDAVARIADSCTVWDNGFVHIIPAEDCTCIILGYHNEHTNSLLQEYVVSWKDLDMASLGGKLTELFAARIESWGLAPSLYRRLSPSMTKRYIKYMSENACNYDISQYVDFNLFNGAF